MKRFRLQEIVTTFGLAAVLLVMLVAGVKTIILANSDSARSLCGCNLPPSTINGLILILLSLVGILYLLRKSR